MKTKTSVLVMTALICLLSPLGWAQTPLVVHASSPISTTEYSTIEEVFVTERASQVGKAKGNRRDG